MRECTTVTGIQEKSPRRNTRKKVDLNSHTKEQWFIAEKLLSALFMTHGEAIMPWYFLGQTV